MLHHGRLFNGIVSDRFNDIFSQIKPNYKITLNLNLGQTKHPDLAQKIN